MPRRTVFICQPSVAPNARGPDRRPILDMLMVSIDIKGVRES